MKRAIFLMIVSVLMCSMGASAQRISYVKNSLATEGVGGASITITEDEGVKQAVALIESKTFTPSTAPGYRFVIFHDSEQFANERASRALSAFRKIFKGTSSYLSVESPMFRIVVGDCYNQEEVAILRNKIDDVYPDAALCEAKVPLRFLLRYQGQNNMLVERSGAVSGGVEIEDGYFDEQQDGDVPTEQSVVIETPADLAEGEVTAVVKRPNTEIVDQQVENVIVIETPVSEQEQEK
jgi:hypothetical protein